MVKALKEEVSLIKNQQDIQKQDIKEIKRHLDAMDQRLDAMNGKFEQVLLLLTGLADKTDHPS